MNRFASQPIADLCVAELQEEVSKGLRNSRLQLRRQVPSPAADRGLRRGRRAMSAQLGRIRRGRGDDPGTTSPARHRGRAPSERRQHRLRLAHQILVAEEGGRLAPLPPGITQGETPRRRSASQTSSSAAVSRPKSPKPPRALKARIEAIMSRKSRTRKSSRASGYNSRMSRGYSSGKCFSAKKRARPGSPCAAAVARYQPSMLRWQKAARSAMYSTRPGLDLRPGGERGRVEGIAAGGERLEVELHRRANPFAGVGGAASVFRTCSQYLPPRAS